MSLPVQPLIERLRLQGEENLPKDEWSDELEQQIRTELSEDERTRFEINMLDNHVHLVLNNQSVDSFLSPKPPVEVYPARPFWQKILPVCLIGIVYFVVAYLTGDHYEKLVSVSFLLSVPSLLGALLAYSANYRYPVPFGKLALALAVFMAGCIGISAVALREGVICIIMASPLLFGGMLIGAALMHVLCRWLWKPHKAVYSIALLPLLWMAAPEQRSDYFGVAQQSTVINATPAQIWQQLNRAEQIKPHEVQDAWAYKIGVPYPVSGVTVQTAEGLVRHSTWQKGIHFDEIIQDWQPNRLVRWTYRFGADSVPKGALDDHVTIGGQHFDLLDTAYRLTSISPTQTRLQITVRYRVSTDFNAYTGRWADALIGNFSSVILNFYKVRSEAVSVALAQS
jgi:hypothetical protein